MRRILPTALAAAALAVTASATAASFPAALTFDLQRGSVNGTVLLGKSPQTLLQSLGKPNLLDGLVVDKMSLAAVRTILTTPSANHHVAVWGKGTAWRVAAQVGLQKTKAPIVWSLLFADPADRETRIGPMLKLTPKQIGQSLRNHYGDTYKVTRGYACGTKAGSCYGVFTSKDGVHKITFGLFGSTKVRFVNVWLAAK